MFEALSVEGDNRRNGREPHPGEEKGLPNCRFVVALHRKDFTKSRLKQEKLSLKDSSFLTLDVHV